MRAWAPSRVPNLDGKTVVITGATSGIGLEAAKVIAQKHARVIIAARDPERAERSIRDFAEEFKKENRPLDILLNNAGVKNPPDRHTEEGFDVTLATNYWGAFYLTHLLLPSMNKDKASRIVFTTSLSEVHGDVDWSDLRGTKIGKSGYRPYARSKLWLVMLTRELQRRLRHAAPGVDIFLAQPGISKTDAFRKSDTRTKLNALFLSAFASVYGQNAARGAQSILYTATAQELEGQGGAESVYGSFYWGLPYIPFGILAMTTNLFNTSHQPPRNAIAYDADACARLYEESLMILGSVDKAFRYDVERLLESGRSSKAAAVVSRSEDAVINGTADLKQGVVRT